MNQIKIEYIDDLRTKMGNWFDKSVSRITQAIGQRWTKWTTKFGEWFKGKAIDLKKWFEMSKFNSLADSLKSSFDDLRTRLNYVIRFSRGLVMNWITGKWTAWDKMWKDWKTNWTGKWTAWDKTWTDWKTRFPTFAVIQVSA